MTCGYGTAIMQVAVELLLPQKLTRNTQEPISRVLFRTACLTAWGYTIVSVPWHEWAPLSYSDDVPRAKMEFLAALLEGVLPPGALPHPTRTDLDVKMLAKSGNEV